MDLSEESTNILYKNTIKYLHDIAEKIPNTSNILKSYYSSKFRISELHTKIILEKNKNKSDARCPQCCLKLRETGSYAVKPETRKSKFARKVLKKLQENKRLTKFQTTYLKENDLKPGNRLVITCSFCKKEVIHKCSKPVKQQVDTNANMPITNKNKKKKKKDKFCGLQKDAVVSVQKNGKLAQKNQVDVQNIVLSNGISQRKQRIKKKKKEKKLNNLLKQNFSLNTVKMNNLSMFLQSFNK